MSRLCLMIACLAPALWLGGATAADLPTGDPRAEGFSPEALGRIGPAFEGMVARKKVAGVASLIARHGKVVHRSAVGLRDVESGKPLDRATLFRIASMTKPITSAAVMILVDEGKVALGDPISKFLPEFKSPMVLARSAGPGGGRSEPVPAVREITVHQLLTHTSGLSYRFSDKPVLGPLYVEAAVSDGLCETPGTIGDNVKRLARLPLLSQPGSEWEYSLSTDVLGRLIEVASGRTLDRFLREKIFVPLRMDDTHFVVPRAERGRLASLYVPGENNTLVRVSETPVQIGTLVFSATFPAWDTGTYYSGGAGLTSTIDDYARFLQMILNRGELDGTRVLKSETVESMARDQIGDLAIPPWGHGEGFGYGFGVVREANRDKDRAGPGTLSWGGFFHTYFWIDVDRRLIGILMAQMAQEPDLHLGRDLKDLAYDALADRRD